MSAVETKNPGHFTTDSGKKVTDEEWGTDQYPLTDSELSYALGKDGVTRRKLARASGAHVRMRRDTPSAIFPPRLVRSAHPSCAPASVSCLCPVLSLSRLCPLCLCCLCLLCLCVCAHRMAGCVMEYVGHIAFLAGTTEERHRARDYLKWLLKQRNGEGSALRCCSSAPPAPPAPAPAPLDCSSRHCLLLPCPPHTSRALCPRVPALPGWLRARGEGLRRCYAWWRS
jgi:hypothetical protein